METPFAYSLFCFKIELLKLEVMRMLSKHILFSEINLKWLL